MKRLLSLLVIPALFCAVAASGAGPTPGAAGDLLGQYEPITPPQPTQSPDKVEVVELFWYGCPHCYEFEPFIKRWLVSKPDYVTFIRMPAVFANNRLWLLHAQAFYTAEALGVLDRVHAALFEAYNKERRPLDSKERLAALFKEQGVSDDEFARAWDSFAVQSRVRQATALTERYRIDGVPAVVVNGKYRTSGSLTGTYANLLKVVDALVEQEHRGSSPALSTKDAVR
jgi:thiol:disulfide interchange protein DsbA